MPHSMVSLEIRPPRKRISLLSCWVVLRVRKEDEEEEEGRGVEEERRGEGTISGFRLRRTEVPRRPTAAERRKPGLERSTRYQRTGLTRARVRETWRVEAQGSLRWKGLVLVSDVRNRVRWKEMSIDGKTYNGKGNTDESADASYSRAPVRCQAPVRLDCLFVVG